MAGESRTQDNVNKSRTVLDIPGQLEPMGGSFRVAVTADMAGAGGTPDVEGSGGSDMARSVRLFVRVTNIARLAI